MWHLRPTLLIAPPLVSVKIDLSKEVKETYYCTHTSGQRCQWHLLLCEFIEIKIDLSKEVKEPYLSAYIFSGYVIPAANAANGPSSCPC